MESLEKVLAAHPFFEGMDKEHLAMIVECATNVRFDAGVPIFREGDDANQFYLLRQGKVAVEIYSPAKHAITIETLDEGDILGWSWIIPPYKWRFDAKAVELVRAIGLDGRCLRAKCDEHTDLGYDLLKRFSNIFNQRLQSTMLQLLDLYGGES
jgi:CRP-like cAMP-binding protein